MLYDHSFFGGTNQFRARCNLTSDGKIPSLPWQILLPPDWSQKWLKFLTAIRTGAGSKQVDQAVASILPIFAFDLNHLPFRPLTTEEVAQVSGLTEQLEDIRKKSGHLSDALVRNICGNSFHPALISSALGNDQDIQDWLDNYTKPHPYECHIPGPTRVLEQYKMLRQQVIQELSREQSDYQQVIQKDMAQQCPFSHLQQIKLTVADFASDLLSGEHRCWSKPGFGFG